jgi:hypothetical protein
VVVTKKINSVEKQVRQVDKSRNRMKIFSSQVNLLSQTRAPCTLEASREDDPTVIHTHFDKNFVFKVFCLSSHECFHSSSRRNASVSTGIFTAATDRSDLTAELYLKMSLKDARIPTEILL